MRTRTRSNTYDRGISHKQLASMIFDEILGLADVVNCNF